jgi:pimeloyl-ACP methyl ester carboxylesterase
MPETLVLVPGLACTRALFEPQIAALGTRREIFVADHTRDDTMAAIAARLVAAAPERFALAGLSMGGYIALEVVRQAPERATRLALLDTNAVADTQERRQLREKQIALSRSGRFGEFMEEIWRKAVHPRRLRMRRCGESTTR